MKLLPSADYFRDNIAFRNDTLLGACEAIGQDLGIHPNFLRIPLAAGITFAPLLMVGLYFALGLVAFVSRTFYLDRVKPPAKKAVEIPAAVNQDMDLPQAA